MSSHHPNPHSLAIIYDPAYTLSLSGLERLHPFDSHKYAKIIDALVLHRRIAVEDIIRPEPLRDEDALLVHAPEYLAKWSDPETVAGIFEVEYIRRLPEEIVRSRIEWTFRLMAGGTIRAGREALGRGVGAVNVGGGLHHAHAAFGSGYCLIADIAIAIRVLQRDEGIRRAMVVDTDVHQGDGNATIFARDRDVFTLSFHQDDLFPDVKAASDLDVPIRAGITDEEYLTLLTEHLPGALDEHRPEIVFTVAGSDVHADDALGGASLTRTGILERDAYVWSECRRRGIAWVMTLGGGYFPACHFVHADSISRIMELARQPVASIGD